jgi:glycosyltransferase involved in cell wall biosynthesis
MKVSVIVPLYNHGPLVAEAIRSALSQTQAPVETLVVDDGSTDDGAAAVAGFGGRVRLLRQPHRGQAAARNRAAREAVGDWLAFLDADDLWLPGKLDAQARTAAANPGAVLLHADGYITAGGAGPLPERTYFDGRVPPEGPDSFRLLLACPLLTPAVMVKREVFLEAGGFNERRSLHEDSELFLRLAARGMEIAYTAEPLVVIRMVERKRDLTAYLLASAAMQADLVRELPAQAPLLRLTLAATWRRLGLLALARDRAGLARADWYRSLAARGLNRKDLAALVLLSCGRPGRRRLLAQNRGLLEELGLDSGPAPGG